MKRRLNYDDLSPSKKKQKTTESDDLMLILDIVLELVNIEEAKLTATTPRHKLSLELSWDYCNSFIREQLNKLVGEKMDYSRWDDLKKRILEYINRVFDKNEGTVTMKGKRITKKQALVFKIDQLFLNPSLHGLYGCTTYKDPAPLEGSDKEPEEPSFNEEDYATVIGQLEILLFRFDLYNEYFGGFVKPEKLEGEEDALRNLDSVTREKLSLATEEYKAAQQRKNTSSLEQSFEESFDQFHAFFDIMDCLEDLMDGELYFRKFCDA